MVAVTPIQNQPPGCPMLIEIEGIYSGYIGWSGPGPGWASSMSQAVHLILRSPEALSSTGDELLFVSGAGDTNFLKDPQEPAWTYRLEWRARAMNGNGALSPWSALRVTRDFSLQR